MTEPQEQVQGSKSAAEQKDLSADDPVARSSQAMTAEGVSGPERALRIRLEGNVETVERCLDALRRAHECLRSADPVGLKAAADAAWGDEARAAEAVLERHAGEPLVKDLLARLHLERAVLAAALENRLRRFGLPTAEPCAAAAAVEAEGPLHFVGVCDTGDNDSRIRSSLLRLLGLSPIGGLVVLVSMHNGETPPLAWLAAAALVIGPWWALQRLTQPRYRLGIDEIAPGPHSVLMTSRRFAIAGRAFEISRLRSITITSPQRGRTQWEVVVRLDSGTETLLLPFGLRPPLAMSWSPLTSRGIEVLVHRPPPL